MNDLMEKASHVAKILKNLSHPKRLILMCELSQESLNVSQLQSRVQLGQSSTSQVLKGLTDQGLIDYEQRGKERFYFLKDEKIRTLIEALYDIYCK